MYNPIMERREELVRLCKKFKVNILYAFGSRNKEIRQMLDSMIAELLPDSRDVDIGVLGKTSLSVEDMVNLDLDLEDFFKVSAYDLAVLTFNSSAINLMS